jgi:RNA polymerase sigma-70 factor (ECF subfamily)
VAGRLVDIVRSALSGRELPDELEPLLAERVAHARAAWPGVIVEVDRLMQAIARRLDPDRPPADALAAMQTDDLYLACGCAAGDAAAIAGFEQHCGAIIDRTIASSGVPPAERADLGQIVRQRLLVAPRAGGAPRIAGYSARGSLQSWVRVIAAREAARILPGARREIAAEEDDELVGLIAPDDDPEIGYFKRRYREEFKRAFHAAVDALEPRERLLLRQHVIDGVGIDRLAALHGVHRATAARWVQAARDAVVEGTQRELARRLKLRRDELATVIDLIRSQLDISLQRVLGR